MTDSARASNNRRLKAANLVPVPLDYLKKDDRFVAIKGSDIFITGTASMDGHQVSENYGFRNGNEYYLPAERNYINVYLEGNAYVPWEHPNDCLYMRDGWRIYVTPEVAARVELDQQANRDWEKNRDKRKLEEKKAQLLRQVDVLQQQIADLG